MNKCKKCNGELRCKEVIECGYHLDCLPEGNMEDYYSALNSLDDA